jgi:Ca2+/H+ antiporter, TMEM165/GDT1 family
VVEAIVPAFLLAVLSQLGDRPAMLTAILADRYGRPLTVAFAALVAHGVGNGIAAAAGMAMVPVMTPNARALLIAVALVFGGLGGFGRMKLPDPLERWRLGVVLTPMLGIFILGLGDRTQFFTLALAARSDPWFAAAGATIGAFGVAFVAAVLGEAGWRALPFRWLRIGGGVVLVTIGAWIGLGALRLI